VRTESIIMNIDKLPLRYRLGDTSRHQFVILDLTPPVTLDVGLKRC